MVNQFEGVRPVEIEVAAELLPQVLEALVVLRVIDELRAEELRKINKNFATALLYAATDDQTLQALKETLRAVPLTPKILYAEQRRDVLYPIPIDVASQVELNSYEKVNLELYGSQRASNKVRQILNALGLKNRESSRGIIPKELVAVFIVSQSVNDLTRRLEHYAQKNNIQPLLAPPDFRIGDHLFVQIRNVFHEVLVPFNPKKKY